MTKVYAVYDSKVSTYATPFFMRTHGEALRGWMDIANDPNSSINKYSADFVLFCIGEYDETTGRLDSYSTPESLGSAAEFKKPTPIPQFNMAQLRPDQVMGSTPQ